MPAGGTRGNRRPRATPENYAALSVFLDIQGFYVRQASGDSSAQMRHCRSRAAAVRH
ncbi:hypothetical protein [Allocoleopsis sp.]|uniref:hypothetical protein n=1 Tax=Allocoleopsis sp. TaxID=3088169 RepID=UPI002FD64831